MRPVLILPLVTEDFPVELKTRVGYPPSKFWLSRPHPGGTPQSQLMVPSAPYTVDSAQTKGTVKNFQPESVQRYRSVMGWGG